LLVLIDLQGLMLTQEFSGLASLKGLLSNDIPANYPEIVHKIVFANCPKPTEDFLKKYMINLLPKTT